MTICVRASDGSGNTRVGQAEQSAPPPSLPPTPGVSARQREIRRNPRKLPGLRPLKRILFWIDFGINAPGTNETREVREREGKKDRRHPEMVGRDGGFVSVSRRRRPWMISPSEIWSTPVKRVDRTSNARRPCRPPPLFFRVSFERSERRLEARFTRWIETGRASRSGSEYPRLPGNSRETGAARGPSNSESVRTIIWRWQRDGQNERSTSSSALSRLLPSFFSFLVSFCLRISINARHTRAVLNAIRVLTTAKMCVNPPPSRCVNRRPDFFFKIYIGLIYVTKMYISFCNIKLFYSNFRRIWENNVTYKNDIFLDERNIRHHNRTKYFLYVCVLNIWFSKWFNVEKNVHVIATIKQFWCKQTWGSIILRQII